MKTTFAVLTTAALVIVVPTSIWVYNEIEARKPQPPRFLQHLNGYDVIQVWDTGLKKWKIVTKTTGTVE
jgi:hypothetical protein